MSSPIHRQVLTPKKPLWVFKLEQKIAEQDERIQVLEDALENATIENRNLRASREPEGVAVPTNICRSNTGQPKTGSPLFRISL
jgi:hypothetical protein|tara:strand:+ start:136 stop:387 length:252 start_codon:yes stop_codon:yes gene_type:complete